MQTLSYIWLTIAILSFFIELLTPTFFFLSVSISGLVAYLLSLFWNNLVIQLIVFVAIFILFFIYLRPIIYKNGPKEKFNASALIGKIVIAGEDINDQKGSVKFEGSIWQARSDKPIIKGTEVKIIKTEGNKLIVTEESK